MYDGVLAVKSPIDMLRAWAALSQPSARISGPFPALWGTPLAIKIIKTKRANNASIIVADWAFLLAWAIKADLFLWLTED